jgi:hypothetical protein
MLKAEKKMEIYVLFLISKVSILIDFVTNTNKQLWLFDIKST